MIVFIDESGDPGFKILKGSTAYFVVVLVVFDDEIDAEETALHIKKLKRKLHLRDNFEFKFNKCNKDLRLAFLEEIRLCNFKIRSIVIRKENIYSKHLRTTKESFYNFSLRMVLEHNNQTIKNAKIRLDGSGDKLFRQKLTTYLRKCLNSKTRQVMKNIRFRDSKKDVLIQLADMIAGSIRRYYEHSTEDWNKYRKIVKAREDDIWEFI
jgi:hypothetical protein